MKRLAKTIVKVLLAYVDIVQKEFDAKELDERTVSFARQFPNDSYTT